MNKLKSRKFWQSDPSSGVRTATKVVAASDASKGVKLQADYVCDGIDDWVEIQAAIDSGATDIYFTEGLFKDTRK